MYIYIKLLNTSNKDIHQNSGKETGKYQAYRAIGHVVMPQQFPSWMLLAIEILHLWDEIFQLHR